MIAVGQAILKRVYLNAPLSINQKQALSDKQFHYLFRVLRCQPEEALIVFNGDGNDYTAHLQPRDKKSADIVITASRTNSNESPLQTTLIQGISKGERMDITIQKAVELGVNAIYPVMTEFCSVKLNRDRQQKKHQHWQAIITSACEQCQRAVIPTLHEVSPFAEIIEAIVSDKKLILHPYADSYPTDTLNTSKESLVTTVTLCIGPEGGFSPTEINLAYQRGFMPIALGNRILRTETAAITALSLAQSAWGDFTNVWV